MTRSIVDPHHHLWDDFGAGAYLLDELRADCLSVPEHVGVVDRTMFMECGQWYRSDGPEHLRPVGETEHVAGIADASAAAAAGPDAGPVIVGIVAGGDLTLPVEQLDELLDAHVAAAGGRFRGIRDALSSAPDGVELLIPGHAPKDKAQDPDFRRGVDRLGERGFTYDTWHYHTQCDDFLALARACEGTTLVLDHFATPLGVGPFHGRRDDIYVRWTDQMAELARCEHVVAKLGGLAMPDNGFGWHTDPSHRPGVDGFLASQERWYRTMIDTFGPDRCMFESNFPVDRTGVDCAVYWEAMDRIAAAYSDEEQDAMFQGTATRVYDLPATTPA